MVSRDGDDLTVMSRVWPFSGRRPAQPHGSGGESHSELSQDSTKKETLKMIGWSRGDDWIVTATKLGLKTGQTWPPALGDLGHVFVCLSHVP